MGGKSGRQEGFEKVSVQILHLRHFKEFALNIDTTRKSLEGLKQRSDVI